MSHPALHAILSSAPYSTSTQHAHASAHAPSSRPAGVPALARTRSVVTTSGFTSEYDYFGSDAGSSQPCYSKGLTPSFSWSTGLSDRASGDSAVPGGPLASLSQAPSRRHAFTDSGVDGDAVLEAIRGGHMSQALFMLREGGPAVSWTSAHDPHDVGTPALLHQLAASYDAMGIQGTEFVYFEVFQQLWQHMEPEDASNPRTLAALFYAAVKFNQTKFVGWVTPILAPLVDLGALVADPGHALNRLHHSALHYIAQNGNVAMLRHIEQHADSVILREARLLLNAGASLQAEQYCSLYVAAAAKHAAYIKAALPQATSEEDRRDILLALLLHGLVPADDARSADYIFQQLQFIKPVEWTLPTPLPAHIHAGPPPVLPVALASVEPGTPEHLASPSPTRSAASPAAGPQAQHPDLPPCLGLQVCVCWARQSRADEATPRIEHGHLISPPKKRESAVERVLHYTQQTDVDDVASVSPRHKPAGFSPALLVPTEQSHAPALSMIDWYLDKFPWLCTRPFTVAVADGSLEWRTAFHTACSIGAQAVASKLLAVGGSQQLNLYTKAASLPPEVLASVPVPLRQQALSCSEEYHPLWLALSHARRVMRFDFMRWLLQHYDQHIIEREIYTPCDGLFAVVPDFIKALAQQTGLSFRRLSGGGSISGAHASASRPHGAQAASPRAQRAADEAAQALLQEEALQDERASETGSVSTRTSTARSKRSKKRKHRRPRTVSLPEAGTGAQAGLTTGDRMAQAAAAAAAETGHISQAGVIPSDSPWQTVPSHRQDTQPGLRGQADDELPASLAGQTRTTRSCSEGTTGSSACTDSTSAAMNRPSGPAQGGAELLPGLQTERGVSLMSPLLTAGQERPALSIRTPTARSTAWQLDTVQETQSPTPGVAASPALDGAPGAAVAAAATAATAVRNDVSPAMPSSAGRLVASQAAAGPSEPERPSVDLPQITGASLPSPDYLPLHLSRMTCQRLVSLGPNGTEVYDGVCGRRRVVIKRVLRTRYAVRDAELADLLSNEAGFPKQLVGFVDDETVREWLYIAMEACDAPLEQALRAAVADAGLSPGCMQAAPDSLVLQGIRVARLLLEAVQVLHARGIVHGRIHPGNILLRAEQAKLADYMLKPLEHMAPLDLALTGWLSPAATAAAMSGVPHTATQADDMFAVSSMLHVILSGGAHPFGPLPQRAHAVLSGMPSLAHSDAGPQYVRHALAQHLLRALLAPSSPVSPAQALAHPLFWSPSTTVQFIAAFADAVKARWGAFPKGRLHPALAAFEAACASHCPGMADWQAVLPRPVATAAPARPPAAARANAQPLQSATALCEQYGNAGLPGVGLVRAVRNIAVAHGHEYVAAASLPDTAALHSAWTRAFPWIPLAVLGVLRQCDADFQSSVWSAAPAGAASWAAQP